MNPQINHGPMGPIQIEIDEQDIANVVTAIRTAEMMAEKSFVQHHVVRIPNGLAIYDEYEVKMRRDDIDEIVYTTGHGYVFTHVS